MPRPVPSSPSEHGTYVPGLDGLRALAVLAVLGYHLGLSHFSGGLLGVGMFFTLSGFLITRILLSSVARTGSFQLKRFWIHRARRLLPAVVIVLTVVMTGTALTDRPSLDRRWSETWSALAYIANWHTIARGQSYFDRFSGPGPLDHLWSLSVEEQFYLVWPLFLLLTMRVVHLSRRHLAAFTAAATVASFSWLSILAAPGFDNTRAYEGTDTRAGGILVGALLAMAWPGLVGLVAPRHWLRVGVQAAGVVGLTAIVWLVAATGDYSLSLYDWGLLTLSLSTAAMVAAVALPGSLLGRALGVEPLRWLGERSYGIYLWQLPVIAAVNQTALAAHRLWWGLALTAVTVLLAELSWRLVEDPIRQRGFTGAVTEIRRHTFSLSHGRQRVIRVPLVPVGAMCLLLVGTGTLVSCHQGRTGPASSLELAGSGIPPIPSDAIPAPTAPSSGAATQSWTGRAVRAARHHAPGHTGHPAGVRRRPIRAHRPPRTSCRQVAYVGESTSLGLMSPLYLPDAADRLPAQLRRHGVRRLRTDILGARSIVERWHDQPNAQEAVTRLRANGFSGCWVIAMGTNDAANQAVGGVYPYAERIDLLMKAIGDQPVLWLTVKSLLSSGPYAESNMESFDGALSAACQRYPDLRLYDWRAEVRDGWYISDGIHFTSAGYAARATRIGDALARAFPAESPPAAGCVVGSGLN